MRPVSLVAVMVLLAGCTDDPRITLQPHAEAAALEQDVPYRLWSVDAQLVAGPLSGQSTGPLELQPWRAVDTQRWRITPLADGYLLRSAASGGALSVSDDGAVGVATDTPVAGQTWQLARRPDGSFSLAYTGNAACLTVRGDAQRGARLAQAPCDTDPSQVWRIQEAVPPNPCDIYACSGHGTCVVHGWQGACTCDAGFHADGLACVADKVAAPVNKRGAGTWGFGGLRRCLQAIAPSWAYSWGPDPGSLAGALGGAEFVPMIWGTRDLNAQALATAQRSGRVLLGINEPDHCDQACMSVDDVVAAWPSLMNTGLRLGSPAPASNADLPDAWLDTFMTAVRTQGLRVDFIPLHRYAASFDTQAAVYDLQDYVQAVYDRYHLPIWVTEYAMINFGTGDKYPTDAQQADFARASAQMLDGLSFVERYAYYSLPPAGEGNTNLCNADGSATSVGRAYVGQ